MSTQRWKFTDTATSEVAYVLLNPNKMSTLDQPRNMTWAWGTKAGLNRIRGIDNANDSAMQFTFEGVILTKSHYDQLLDWAGRLTVLRIDDHIDRAFKVMIQQFDPIERQRTKTRQWRADYTMTCLFLERIT